MNTRRFFTWGLAALATSLAWPASSWAADYPNKSVRLVVGYPPGGTTDLLARLVGTHLQAQLKQSVVVENKAGAGGGIGADAVAKAPRDGYTLGLGSAGNLALNYASYTNIAYDSLKDFSLLSPVASMPNVLVVNSSVPANNVEELRAYLQKKGSAFFASTGAGNGPHLTGELFNRPLKKWSPKLPPARLARRWSLAEQNSRPPRPFSGPLRSLFAHFGRTEARFYA